MRLLLDTHVFVWAAASPTVIAQKVRRAIEDPENEVFLSAAAAWEIAIKYTLGKLSLPADPTTWVPTRAFAFGFKSLPIVQHHALALLGLPPHHQDPFDRIMVAQAVVEGLTIVTRDQRFRAYPIHVLAA